MKTKKRVIADYAEIDEMHLHCDEIPVTVLTETHLLRKPLEYQGKVNFDPIFFTLDCK